MLQNDIGQRLDAAIRASIDDGVATWRSDEVSAVELRSEVYA